MALELARRGRARSVVGLSPAGGFGRRADRYRLAAKFGLLTAARPLAAPSPAGSRPGLRRLSLRLVAEHGERLTPAQFARMAADMAGCPLLGTVIDAARHDTGGALALRPFASLPCPVRIAWGEHDRMIPWRSYGRPVADALPGAEVLLLRRLGHVPMIDDPGLVADTILSSVRAVERRRAEDVANEPIARHVQRQGTDATGAD